LIDAKLNILQSLCSVDLKFSGQIHLGINTFRADLNQAIHIKTARLQVVRTSTTLAP